MIASLEANGISKGKLGTVLLLSRSVTILLLHLRHHLNLDQQLANLNCQHPISNCKGSV
jgi:hypothetical protein